MMKKYLNQAGFTLIELILVLGILATLMGITYLNVLSFINSSVKESSTSVLASDLKSQQLKAMIGDTEGRGAADEHGIIIQGNQYTLFHGTTFNPSDDSNFTIEIDDGFTISSTFQNDTIIFSRGSGEILNFVDGQDTITVSNSSTGEGKTLELNGLGVIIAD